VAGFPAPAASTAGLERRLTATDAAAIIISHVIGGGMTACFIVVNELVRNPAMSAAGLLIIGVGLPLSAQRRRSVVPLLSTE
jgi:hypothetical protein